MPKCRQVWATVHPAVGPCNSFDRHVSKRVCSAFVIGSPLLKAESLSCYPSLEISHPGVASSRNIKIHKHFVAALTPEPTRAPSSQPNPDPKIALLNKFDASMDRRG